MLLRLLPLICMFVAAAAQRTYYCNSFAGVIRDSDFYLVTLLNQTDRSYPPGLSCEFNAESSSAAFLVEIQTFSTYTAVLTVNSMGNTLFRGSQLAGSYQKAIATPSSNLRVRFDATGDYSYRSGVRLRVRAFDTVGCPPDWQYLYGNCYGTSTAPGLLNYTDAQKACNSMRSNLLHLPSNYAGSLISFRNMLNSNLRSYYTWIGLTDRSTRYRHTWLNSVRQIFASDISCYSGGASTTCFSDERCGTFYGTKSYYAVFMDRCSKSNNYACSMPPGGTGNFYSVPYQTDSSTVYPRTNTYVDSGVIWGSVVAGIVIISIIVGAVYGGIHHSQMRRDAGARNVILSAGRLTVPPPQPGFQMQVQQSAAVYYPPPQVVPPPPAYDVAVGSGYPGNVNMGYAK